MALKQELASGMGNRTRVRVGAIIIDDSEECASILLVRHAGIWDSRPFWTPPGGEVSFGEPLEEALEREVFEETGLLVSAGSLQYAVDFVRAPLHAVALYFLARVIGGQIRRGTDPELSEQLIQEAAYIRLSELSDYYIVPEGIELELCKDAEKGFGTAARYLGTRR